MNIETKLLKCHSDKVGRPRIFQQVLLEDFAIPHKWYYETESGQWIKGESNDMDTFNALGRLDPHADDYTAKKKHFKRTLQVFTPSSSFSGELTGVMQLDFDLKGIGSYDLEELKRCVFALPFVGFCALSCSGTGFYALALISEPEKLKEYVEHCHEVLLKYGIIADQGKGKNPSDKRYVSYDPDMLVREYPMPLEIKNFYTKSAAKSTTPTRREISPHNRYSAEDNRIAVEAIIKAVEADSIAITGSYNLWLAIGCDLAATFGEDGCEYFHSICQCNPNYTPEGVDKKYKECLKLTSGKPPGLGALINAAKANGIDVKLRIAQAAFAGVG